MSPLPSEVSQPWNIIPITDILDALNPHTCIRCEQLKPEPGVNTLCASCQKHLDAPQNAAERFLFSTCLRIYDFFLWMRRKTLSDTFALRNREHGTVVEHYIGLPGDKQDLPYLNGAARLARRDSGDQGPDLSSPMERELLEQVMLTSRQGDRVLVRFADIMEQEMLQADSPVLKIDEILFDASHAYTSTHWCYRTTMHDGRCFALAFSDRQLGWLHIVRDWDEYVLDRFHETDEAEARFYVEYLDERDPDELTEVEKNMRYDWKERGVSVSRLGGVQAAHLSQWYPQAHWSTAAKDVWAGELPPCDMFTEDRPEGWEPERGLSDEQIERRQRRFGCHLVRDDGGMKMLWQIWRHGS